VTVLADTSGIVAILDRDDRHHAAAVEIVQSETILVPATVLPEVDYLTNKYLGERVARAFLEDLVEGYFSYLAVDLNDIEQALKVMARYKDVPLGLVDASLVALAQRHRIQRILTLDRRHFSLIKPEKIPSFELLP
jgi:predicted nucleic acid-binding protein